MRCRTRRETEVSFRVLLSGKGGGWYNQKGRKDEGPSPDTEGQDRKNKAPAAFISPLQGLSAPAGGDFLRDAGKVPYRGILGAGANTWGKDIKKSDDG